MKKRPGRGRDAGCAAKLNVCAGGHHWTDGLSPGHPAKIPRHRALRSWGHPCAGRREQIPRHRVSPASGHPDPSVDHPVKIPMLRPHCPLAVARVQQLAKPEEERQRSAQFLSSCVLLMSARNETDERFMRRFVPIRAPDPHCLSTDAAHPSASVSPASSAVSRTIALRSGGGSFA